MANSVTIKGESGGAIGVGTTSPTSGSLTVDKSSFSTPAVDLKTSGTSFGQLTLTDTNNLSIGCTTSNHTGITFGSTYLPRYNGSNNNGDVDIGAASFRYKDLYLAGGVVFDAVTGSATSNTLDDYEEGTFTPAADSFSGTMTFTTARYVKIGKLVHVNFKMTSDGNGDTDQISISGFPFSAVAEHPVSTSHNMAGNGAMQSHTIPSVPNAMINTAEIMYVYLPSGGAFQYAFMGSGFIRVSGTYITA